MIKKQTNFFYDCATESPQGRRSYYDQEALESRKKFKPEKQCSDVAAAMGFPLTEAEYKELQQLGNFDTKLDKNTGSN
jgi:hypothetical protein